MWRGGEVRRLTGRSAFEASPAFSPDGALVAFAYPRAGDPAGVMEVQLARVSVATGEASSATAQLDRSILLHSWMPGSSSLLVAANDGTRSGLWVQPFEALGGTAEARRIEIGPIAAFSELSVAPTGAIALVGSEALRPNELYVLDSPEAKPRRLTDFHGEIAALDLARSESLEWESEDGFRSDGVLTFPPEFDGARGDLDRRWPLVVYLHGGPTASSNEAFDELAQLMAARGWVVLQPNYRGSDNRGEAHQRGIVAGAGSGPGRDVMAGVETVRRRGFVDEDRIAVSGWSYGGFMTVWMLGHYPGWRVAVAGAAALDLVDMYSLSDLNVMRRHAITGSPWTGGGKRSSARSHRSRASPRSARPRSSSRTLVMRASRSPSRSGCSARCATSASRPSSSPTRSRGTSRPTRFGGVTCTGAGSTGSSSTSQHRHRPARPARS